MSSSSGGAIPFSKEPGSAGFARDNSAPQTSDGGQPRPAPGPSQATGQDHGNQRRSLWRKLLTPIVLAVIGAALFVVALELYGTPPEAPTSPYATIFLDATFPINTIDYNVQQLSPKVAKVTIEVDLYDATPPRDAPTAQWELTLPRGIAFQTCPKSFCTHPNDDPAVDTWTHPLKFTTIQGAGIATTDVFVKAENLGETFNGLTASASMPQVFLSNSSKQPTLLTKYMIPSASSYDWSSFQPYYSDSRTAVWSEEINGDGQLDGRAALGINHSSQTDDENKTFFAGALLGLAGAALLSAIQEALRIKE